MLGFGFSLVWAKGSSSNPAANKRPASKKKHGTNDEVTLFSILPDAIKV